jgi:hypothetical protein
LGVVCVEYVLSRGLKKRLTVERFDSEPVKESVELPLLVEGSFFAERCRAVLSP